MRLHPAAEVAAGASLLALLVLPSTRHALEAGMRPHMLVQYPLVMLAGALLSRATPKGLRQRLGDWNAMGLSGLAMLLCVTTVLMIPRVLDLALVDPMTETLKFAALLLAGALLPASWSRAGRVLQAFLLGSVLPMASVVGVLLQDSSERLCSAYRLDEQQRLGNDLVWIAATVALVWLWRTGRELMTSELRTTSRPRRLDAGSDDR